MEIANRLRKKIADENLMFAYRGEVTGDNSVMLLTLLEREMEVSDFGIVGRKRLFMFVLENLQNITRHGTSPEHDVSSLVMYSKTPEGYTVTTGNAISSKEVPGLRRNLENINRLEPDQIREVYRKLLQTSTITAKGGAGLGLLEMARKTGNRLDYDFIPVDDKLNYFILSKTVDAGGKGLNAPGAEGAFNGRRILQIEKMMRSNNIYFIWAGPLTYDIGREVLSFTETRMQEEELEHNLQKRVFTTLIELLQNVSQHSPGLASEKKYGMPVAFIRNMPASFIITVGNLIRKSDISRLKQKLDMVNKYDEEGLNKLLKSALAGQDMEKASTGYMGLLEMARRSGNKLEYRFEEVNEEFSYFLIKVKVRAKFRKVQKRD